VADPFLVRRIRAGADAPADRAAEWAELLPLIAEFWLRVLAKVEARHAPGRLKQWLNLLRRNFPRPKPCTASCAPRPIRGRSTTSWSGMAPLCGRPRIAPMYANSRIPESAQQGVHDSSSSSPARPLRSASLISITTRPPSNTAWPAGTARRR
jgi:hypothetical protein